MEKKRLFGIFLLLLVCLVSQEMVVPVEARYRVCQSLSHYYKGPCLRDHNCAMVCRNEAFSGGRCKGFRRRCFCTKLC
ncbi:hypothetical protein K2173_011972 [Erythroxylum novogranatense]|uniref:Knottins-like domain-containing protein n=1 Tax=Erythroxylum novogranatense TaxID=1862640 RepID=A0AAV8TG84_9ROSI|nr:hypothetical protein K2173_011972 [Erythroxylum novogranatense]